MSRARRRARALRLTPRGWGVLGLILAGAAAGGSYAAVTFLREPVVDAAGPADALATPPPSPTPSPSPTPRPAPLPGPSAPRQLATGVAVAPLDGLDPTHAAALTFFEAAPTVVVTDGRPPTLDVATALALRLRVPLLVDGPGISAVLEELGAVTAVTVGEVSSAASGDIRAVE
ncbi:MAG: hypothetical protein R3320_03785, partial [Nitriliruptorales bacterium]|nr:hypothetical protein [Nitriliruptorales bacterium]